MSPASLGPHAPIGVAASLCQGDVAANLQALKIMDDVQCNHIVARQIRNYLRAGGWKNKQFKFPAQAEGWWEETAGVEWSE